VKRRNSAAAGWRRGAGARRRRQHRISQLMASRISAISGVAYHQPANEKQPSAATAYVSLGVSKISQL